VDLGRHEVLTERLARALAAELPQVTRDGGFVAAGYSDELDRLRGLRDDARRMIAALETRYREAAGVATLKIRHNNVLGYYVETTPVHADKLKGAPGGLDFIHRQSLASAVR